MRLEDLLKSKLQKIEERAETEKAVVKYLGDLIEDNYNSFAKSFNIIITEKLELEEYLENIKKEINNGEYDKFREEFFNNELYNEVEKTIKEVDEELTKVIGITLYDKNFNHPKITLGWAEYFSDDSETIKITEKGREIVNGYRKAQGFVDSKKQKEANIKSWDKMIQNRDKMLQT